jgi:hypothetical protein
LQCLSQELATAKEHLSAKVAALAEGQAELSGDQQQLQQRVQRLLQRQQQLEESAEKLLKEQIHMQETSAAAAKEEEEDRVLSQHLVSPEAQAVAAGVTRDSPGTGCPGDLTVQVTIPGFTGLLVEKVGDSQLVPQLAGALIREAKESAILPHAAGVVVGKAGEQLARVMCPWKWRVPGRGGSDTKGNSEVETKQ